MEAFLKNLKRMLEDRGYTRVYTSQVVTRDLLTDDVVRAMWRVQAEGGQREPLIGLFFDFTPNQLDAQGRFKPHCAAGDGGRGTPKCLRLRVAAARQECAEPSRRVLAFHSWPLHDDKVPSDALRRACNDAAGPVELWSYHEFAHLHMPDYHLVPRFTRITGDARDTEVPGGLQGLVHLPTRPRRDRLHRHLALSRGDVLRLEWDDDDLGHRVCFVRAL